MALGLIVNAAHAGALPGDVSPQLSKFGLYALSELKINDRVHVPPGWIGSNDKATLLINSVIDANVHARGDVVSYSRSLRGDLNYGGQLILTTKADSVLGRVHRLGSWGEDTTHALEFEPPEADPVVIGPDTSIEPGSIFTIAKNYPNSDPVKTSWGTIIVKSRATLILQPTVFRDLRFKGLILEPDARLVVRFPVLASGYVQPIQIEIGEVFSINRASVILENGGPQGLLWKVWNRDLTYPYVYFGPGSHFQGTLLAPRASINVEASAKVTGALIGNRIEVHQGNAGLTFVPYTGKPGTADVDADGLDDTLEMRLGTNPFVIDTDEDGLSDGLEYWGRGTAPDGTALHRFGAVNDLRNGFYLKERQDTLLNPLRRDVLVRFHLRDTSASKFLLTHQLDASLAMSRGFGKADHYAEVVDSAFQYVGTRRMALHVDAGEGLSVNWPSDAGRWGTAAVEHYGGESIVPSGGTNEGKGPWSWDTIAECGNGALWGGDPIRYTMCAQDERISWPEINYLRDKWVKNWPISETFRDAVFDMFVVNDHVYWHGKVARFWGAATFDRHALATPGTSTMAGPFPSLVWHEMGHELGLGNDISVQYPFRPSIFRYGLGLWGCDTTRWDSSAAGVKGTWRNTRWCGEDPARYVVWDSVVRNGTTERFASMLRTGLSDPLTGWDASIDNEWRPENLSYSNGRYCPLDLTALNEREGRATCFDRNHKLLAQPILGEPIDWNGNGLLDEQPVDIWTDPLTRKRWFPQQWAGIEPREVYEFGKKDDAPNEWDKLDPKTGLGGVVLGIHCPQLGICVE